MGWTTMHRDAGISHKEWFASEFPTMVKNVVDLAVKSNVMYIAYRRPEDQKVIALVFLIRWFKDEYNFGYKDMEESMGPNEHDCPERILSLLSPVEELYQGYSLEWAKAWRDGCWAKIKTRQSAPKLEYGALVDLGGMVHFTNGKDIQYMRVAQVKPLRFAPDHSKHPDCYGLYRLSRDMVAQVKVIEA